MKDNERNCSTNHRDKSEKKCNKKRPGLSKMTIEHYNRYHANFQNVWEKRFRELEEYKAKHGDCNVPSKYPSLGNWVRRQRVNYNDDAIPESRLLRLEKIGFDFRDQKQIMDRKLWEKRFRELAEYKRRNGHCHVPRSNKSHNVLAEWCRTQRRNFEKGKIKHERLVCLQRIGFHFE